MAKINAEMYVTSTVVELAEGSPSQRQITIKGQDAEGVATLKALKPCLGRPYMVTFVTKAGPVSLVQRDCNAIWPKHQSSNTKADFEAIYARLAENADAVASVQVEYEPLKAQVTL